MTMQEKTIKAMARLLRLLKKFDPHYRITDITNFRDLNDIIIPVYSTSSEVAEAKYREALDILVTEGIRYSKEVVYWDGSPVYTVTVFDSRAKRNIEICFINRIAETRNKEVVKHWSEMIESKNGE